MMQLTTKSYQIAADFIKNNATGPDRALFEYFFETGSKQNVLNELAAYQNEDGGFGGLEYDFELETSSVMATVKAFQYFDRLQLDSTNPMVQKGIKYFLDDCNEQRYDWQSVPPEVNDVPHAFWWSYNPPSDRSNVEDMNWEDFVAEYNPNTNAGKLTVG